jgi:hypothetical protein
MVMGPPPTHRPRRQALTVGLVGLVLAGAMVAGLVDGADPTAGEGRTPFVTLYSGTRDQIEAVLVSGDGQAFAAIAQDPLLQRPELVPGDGEFAYRAQRPVWGYLAWLLSAGQAGAVGWALAVMTVLAAGFCVAVLGLLLQQRGQSPWWALAVLLAGTESLSQLTPELFALGLLGLALGLPRVHRGWAVALLCVAVMTRETTLVAVAAWALYDLVHTQGGVRVRLRAVAPFAIPVAVFAGWVVLLRARVGTWTWEQPHDRAGAPFAGLRHAFDPVSGRIALGVTVAVGLCALCLWLARRDVLTWIAVAFATFATTFAGQVWTGAGYERTLLPLYTLGGIAALTGVRQRAASESAVASLAMPFAGTDNVTKVPSGPV